MAMRGRGMVKQDDYDYDNEDDLDELYNHAN